MIIYKEITRLWKFIMYRGCVNRLFIVLGKQIISIYYSILKKLETIILILLNCKHCVLHF